MADNYFGQYGTGNAITSGGTYDYLTNRNTYAGTQPNDQTNYTPEQLKGWFSGGRTPDEIAAKAAELHMTAGGVAQAIATGTGAAYDPGAVNNWLSQNSTYGTGEDGRVVNKSGVGNGVGPANTGTGYGGGGSNLGFTSSSISGGPNPYLAAQADDIGRRSNAALGTNLQGIRSNSVATGGLGGSRQGVAEGTAIASANDTLQGNLANLYGTDYTNQQNRNLQAYGIDSSAATSRYGVDSNAATSRYGIDTNAALTNQNQMQNFYTANRGLDQSGQALGMNMYNQGNAGLMGQGQGVYNIGNTQQQAPWTVINSANAGISPYTGYGATNTQTGTSGGGAQGMVGGALAGAQIGKNLGLGSSSGTGSNGYAYNDYASNWGANNGSQNMYQYSRDN